MAKGAVAKTNVISKIASAFGDDYIGEVDKKVYVWADDGGERVQIAIAMTCPKNPVEAPGVAVTISDNSEGHNWDEPAASPAVSTVRAEVTEEEKQRIADMMAKFGL